MNDTGDARLLRRELNGRNAQALNMIGYDDGEDAGNTQVQGRKTTCVLVPILRGGGHDGQWWI